MRIRTVFVAVCLTAAAFVSPMHEQLAAQNGSGIMISEFRFRGPNGANDEFIELFNSGLAAVDVGGWVIRSSNTATRINIPRGTAIEPGCHYLVVNLNAAGGYSGAVTGDRSYTAAAGFTDDGGVAVTHEDGFTIVDQVGGPTGGFGEGTRLPARTDDVDRGTQRRRSATNGHRDTDDNAADFEEVSPANPENASSACFVAPPVIRLPHDIQGPGATSPFAVGSPVIVRGVVTGRKSDGFFLQTEAGMEDADPNTSEGLFVSANGNALDAAQVGHLVDVRGSVAEFVPYGTDNGPRTQLDLTSVLDLGASSSLPAASPLTTAELSDAGTLDQLEKFEGMRVMVASLTSITGTGAEHSEVDWTWTSDGAFYAVLTGQARPFRQPGIAPGSPVLACQMGPCNIPIFDGNPERLRVDSNGLESGAAVELSSGAVVTNVTGPLDFESGDYTLLPELPLVPMGGSAVTPAPAAAANQFTVASFKLGPVAEATRLVKASLAIRTVLNSPDVLGVQDVEDIDVLQQLAAQIDADAGGAAPEYEAVLFEGTDPDGLDIGVLYKTAGGRVSVTSVEQVGDASTFERPSVKLSALIQGPPTSMPQTVTVIVNHLRSLAYVGNDDEFGAAVRAQRRAQAEALATYINDRQLNDPAEAIVAIGDYNAFAFNDGYVDVVGTILGTPAPEDQLVAASTDLVSPDLVNLASSIAATQRYSSLDHGNAQALNHALVSANLVGQFAGLVYPRVNADFPASLLDDDTTPQRSSDTDPVVAYFLFPADVEAPVFSFTPEDLEVEATSAAGAVVTFTVPTATDNLDGDVAVACVPASGATLPLGNTGVTCTAADAAGNVAPVSFTVTVEDTTAPQVTLPANITAQATSAAGRVVTFTASATDAVTSGLVVTCAPASGSVFPIGVTTVQCSTADGAGNPAGGTFTVTIGAVTPPPSLPGHIYGAGTIGTSRARTAFALEVRESSHHVDRGWIVVKVGSKCFVAGVSSAVFTNTPTSSPASYPRSGNISVSVAGVGWWDGRPGYTFEAAAADLGNPGRGRDTFTLVVRSPSGSVVANVTGTLTSGELRSSR